MITSFTLGVWTPCSLGDHNPTLPRFQKWILDCLKVHLPRHFIFCSRPVGRRRSGKETDVYWVSVIDQQATNAFCPRCICQTRHPRLSGGWSATWPRQEGTPMAGLLQEARKLKPGLGVWHEGRCIILFIFLLGIFLENCITFFLTFRM